MTDAETPERHLDTHRPDLVRNAPLLAPGYRKSWAVIIGINYDDRQAPVARLSNAQKDAETVQTLLQEYYGFPEDNIISLIGASATYDAIRGTLLDTLGDREKISRNDRVLIFYAGHGAAEDDEGFLIPADYVGTASKRIPMTDLQRAWKNTRAKHVLCIVDCCFSGLATRQRGSAVAYEYDSTVTQYPAWQIITAGNSGEKTADSFLTTDGPSQHSYLAHFLVDALKNGIPNKLDLTAETLYLFLKEKVVQASAKHGSPQHPTFGNHAKTYTSEGWIPEDRGMFLLARSTIALPRTIAEGLRSDDTLKVRSAINELKNLFLSIEQPEALDRDDPHEIEGWRNVIAPKLLEIVYQKDDSQIIQDAGALLASVLRGSPTLQEDYSEHLIKLLNNQHAARVEQAAAILTSLSSDTNPNKAVVSGKVEAQQSLVRSALERAIVQDSPELTFSALQAFVRLFPHEKAQLLPWLRLKLMDSQADERTHMLAFETLPMIGDNLDIRLIKQVLERHLLNSKYRRKATESLDALLARLKQDGDLEPNGCLAALNLLFQVVQFDADSPVRGSVIEAALLSDDPKWLDRLSVVLADPSADIRKYGLVLLSERPIESHQLVAVSRNIAILLENEPLPFIRALCCDALGKIWRDYIEAAGGSMQFYHKRNQPSVISLLDDLRNLLSKALGDSDAQVRQHAARAFGQSRDVLAVEAIQEYLQRELEIRRMIKPILVATKDDLSGARSRRDAAIQQLNKVVPVSFPELVEAYLLLLAGVVDDAAVWQEVTREVYLIFEAAREFGGPEFLDLFDESLSSAFGRSLDQICDVVAQAESYLQTLRIWMSAVAVMIGAPAVWSLLEPGQPATALESDVMIGAPAFRPLLERWLLLPLDEMDDIVEQYELCRPALQALMLAVSYESGDPAFMPLVQLWLRQPPEHYSIDEGTERIQGELHLRAIHALGQQQRDFAIEPALGLLQRVLDSQPGQRPALIALIDCLTTLNHPKALTSLVDLLTVPALQSDDATEVRLAVAVGLRKVLLTPNINHTVRNRVLQRAEADPSADVRQALTQALRSVVV